MELLHDYRVNAFAREIDTARAFRRAELSGLTTQSGVRLRWFGWRFSPAGRAHAESRTLDLQAGS